MLHIADVALYSKLSLVRRDQSGDDIKKRAFSAAAWTEQGDEFTLVYVQRNVLDDLCLAITLADAV
ncbi:hypothetical protein D3C73_1550900 [compost metagenome]